MQSIDSHSNPINQMCVSCPVMIQSKMCVLLPHAVHAELRGEMAKERDFTRKVQRRHLAADGDPDRAEEILLMAQTQQHSITQMTGVVSSSLAACSLSRSHFGGCL